MTSQYEWVDLGDGRQICRKIRQGAPPALSDLPRPMIITDQMPPTEHPFDGGIYTSKSSFRRVTKAGGGIEVGNDPQRLRAPERKEPNRKEIRAALERAKAKLT